MNIITCKKCEKNMPMKSGALFIQEEKKEKLLIVHIAVKWDTLK